MPAATLTTLARLTFALVTLGLAPDAVAQSAWLTWAERDECPTAADVERRVRELVHGDLPTALRVRAQVTPVDGAWAVAVEVVIREHAGKRRVTVSSPRAATLAASSRAMAQPVDCSWLRLAQAHVCACTDVSCFAATSPDAEGLDVRLSEDGSELSGSLLSETVHLTRQ